jgi:intracellular sulfur oxidation DsrE/DsrF family protein
MARSFSMICLALLLCLAGSPLVTAADDDGFAKRKVVLQSSSADPDTQGLVLVIAGNLQKHYGMDNVKIEVVAYGPGLGLLTKENPNAKKVKSLADHNITFSACGGTLAFMEKQTGKRPELTPGVRVVDDGVVRIIELQDQGYAYVYPK